MEAGWYSIVMGVGALKGALDIRVHAVFYYCAGIVS
jgi:hypothetical protein